MTHFPFQRLQADLAKLIADTPPGSRLTSEPELAKQMGVSRATLREAMRTFETQGLIRRRQGSGTYKVDKFQVIEAGLEVLESLETMARRMNLEVSVSDLSIEQIDADRRTAEGLCVNEGTRVYLRPACHAGRGSACGLSGGFVAHKHLAVRWPDQ